MNEAHETTSPAVSKYVDLLDSFLCGKIDGPRFEQLYLDAWREDRDLFEEHSDGPSESESRVLEELFYDVDSFCSDPALFDEKLDIDEDELRSRAKVAIRKLQG